MKGYTDSWLQPSTYASLGNGLIFENSAVSSIKLGDNVALVFFLYIVPRLGLFQETFHKAILFSCFSFAFLGHGSREKRGILQSFPRDDGEGGDKATCPILKSVHNPFSGARLVKSACCSCRRLRFDSQHLHSGSQLSETQFQGTQCPPLASWAQGSPVEHMQQNTYT